MNRIAISLFLLCSFFMTNELQAAGKEKDGRKKGAEEEKDLIVTMTPSNYDEVVSKGVVFVDYWAAWCGPCRRMNPILKEVAAEREGKVVIAKLNVDHFEQFTTEKRVSNLPTIIVYKDGKELSRVSGLVSKQKLLEVVDYLSSVEK